MFLFQNSDVAAGSGIDALASSRAKSAVAPASGSPEVAAANQGCDELPAPVARAAPDRSHHVFAWSIGIGLALLVACLAAVLVIAGLSVEVLP
jgi:hypothetical protein